MGALGLVIPGFQPSVSGSSPPAGVTADYRPDLRPDQEAAAIRIASAGGLVPHPMVAEAITAYPPDGGFYAAPTAYVSVHPHVDADPVAGGLIDLAAARIVDRWEVAEARGGPLEAVQGDSGARPEFGTAVAVPGLLPEPGVGIDWGGWRMSLEVSVFEEGLTLRDVSFSGRPVAVKLSMPVMTVFYARGCGPFADRIGRPLPAIDWAGGAEVSYRQLDIDGVTWREVGVRALIGDYDLFQSYLFSPSGVIEARLAGSGLQCLSDHTHHPTFRAELAVDGGSRPDVVAERASGALSRAVEFDAAVASGWQVADPITATTVIVEPAREVLGVGSGGSLVPARDGHRLGVRRPRSVEDAGWRRGASTSLPHLDGELLSTPSLVLWYQGLMGHRADDGAAHWHVTGLRLSVVPSGPRPPAEIVDAASATERAERGSPGGKS